MKYCVNCGAMLNDEDRFCTCCGHKNEVKAVENSINQVVEPVVEPVAQSIPASEPEVQKVYVDTPKVEQAAPEAENDILAAALAMENNNSAYEAPKQDSYAGVTYEAPKQDNFAGVAYGNTANYSGYNNGSYGSNDNYQNESVPNNPPKDKKPLISMILGIAGMELASTGILGIGLGIPALILSKSAKNSERKNERVFGKLGKIFGIISIVLGAICAVAIAIVIGAYFVSGGSNITKYFGIDDPGFSFTLPTESKETVDDVIAEINDTTEDAVAELASGWKDIDAIDSKKLIKNIDEIESYLENLVRHAKTTTSYYRNATQRGYEIVAKNGLKDDEWEDEILNIASAASDGFDKYFEQIDTVLEGYYDKIDEVYENGDFDDYDKLYDIYSDVWDELYDVYSESWNDIYYDYEAVYDGFYDGETDVEKLISESEKNR